MAVRILAAALAVQVRAIIRTNIKEIKLNKNGTLGSSPSCRSEKKMRVFPEALRYSVSVFYDLACDTFAEAALVPQATRETRFRFNFFISHGFGVNNKQSRTKIT